MQGNRSRDTRPEIALRSALHRMGLRFRVHTRPFPEGRWTADVVFRAARVAVFVDGCFWHGCTEHGTRPSVNSAYWSGKLTRNRERDQKTDALLLAAGWVVVRVWEHEQPYEAARRVADIVRLRCSSGPPD